MAAKRTTNRLEAYERRYRELACQLADVGYVASGSVAPRYNRCGKASCGCHADPPRLHSPYFQWTAKVGARRSIGDSRRVRPRSTVNGSATIDEYAPSSLRCVKWRPRLNSWCLKRSRARLVEV